MQTDAFEDFTGIFGLEDGVLIGPGATFTPRTPGRLGVLGPRSDWVLLFTSLDGVGVTRFR